MRGWSRRTALRTALEVATPTPVNDAVASIDPPQALWVLPDPGGWLPTLGVVEVTQLALRLRAVDEPAWKPALPEATED